MPKGGFKLNSAGVGELLKSAEVRAQCTKAAEGVLGRAKGNAPVDSGAYRDSIHIEQDTTDRAAVRVVADVPYATIVESKTGNLARSL